MLDRGLGVGRGMKKMTIHTDRHTSVLCMSDLNKGDSVFLWDMSIFFTEKLY